MNQTHRLGIDIGGTFTDFSLLDERSGELVGFKSPTIPSDPAQGVLDGLRSLVAETQVDPGEIGSLVHGTTIAINTVKPLIEQLQNGQTPATEQVAYLGVSTQQTPSGVTVDTVRR